MLFSASNTLAKTTTQQNDDIKQVLITGKGAG